MRGIVLAEQGHIVNVLPPKDITGGATGQRFHLKEHGHASILVQLGVSAAAPTSIVVSGCSAADGTGAEAIGFSYYDETTAAGDTLSERKTVAATGITSVTANDNTMYLIELDAAELPAGKPYVQVTIAAPASSILASVSAILTGARYAGVESGTVIT